MVGKVERGLNKTVEGRNILFSTKIIVSQVSLNYVPLAHIDFSNVL